MARMIDADAMLAELKPITYEMEHTSVLISDMSNIMRNWVERQPTLSQPNEWVNRVRELDELYTKLQFVTGFTAKQLLEIFAAGYTLKKPDYSKKFTEMENLAEAVQPNEPLTCDGCISLGTSYGPCMNCIRSKLRGDMYRRGGGNFNE